METLSIQIMAIVYLLLNGRSGCGSLGRIAEAKRITTVAICRDHIREPGESSSYEMQRKNERMLSELSKTSKSQTGHIFLILTFCFLFS